MKYKLFIFLTSIIFAAILIPYFFTPSASALSLGCVVTKVGNPDPALPSPTFPPGCTSLTFTPTGVIPDPDIDPTLCISVTGGQYCKIPDDPPNGEYIKVLHGPHDPWQDWGSRDMINLLYTVAQNWKYLHPQGFLIIGDVASAYHGWTRSDGSYTKGNHVAGIASDIRATTDGKDCVADHANRCNFIATIPETTVEPGTYNPEATIELGKLFMNTGVVRQILYWDQNTNAFNELKNYGDANNTHMGEDPEHKNHFHIDTRFQRLPDCDTTSPKAC